jgi:hypothetical protein
VTWGDHCNDDHLGVAGRLIVRSVDARNVLMPDFVVTGPAVAATNG